MVRMPKGDRAQLKEQAIRRHLKESDILREAIREYLGRLSGLKEAA